MRWGSGRAWGCLRKKNQEELDKMQQPGILKMCPVPTLPAVPAPSLNSRLWASPHPRLSSAHSALTSLLLRLWRPLNRTSSGSPSRLTAPHFQLRPARSQVSGSPRPNHRPRPCPSPAAPALASSVPPRPELRPLGSYQLVPPHPTQAPRSQSAAATLRPEPG